MSPSLNKVYCVYIHVIIIYIICLIITICINKDCERWIKQHDTSSCYVDQFISRYWAQNTPFSYHLSLLTVTMTLLILTVCRTRVTYELSLMTLLSTSSRRSVERAPARCSGGHGLKFFLCPTLVSYWLLYLSHFTTETIFISINKVNLIGLRMHPLICCNYTKWLKLKLVSELILKA